MKIETKYKYLSYLFYILIGFNFLLWSNQFVDYTNTLRFFSLSASLSMLLISSLFFKIEVIDFKSLWHPGVIILGAGIIVSILSLGNANNPIAGLFLVGNSILSFTLLLIVIQLMQQHLNFLKEISQLFTIIVFVVLSVGFLDYLSVEANYGRYLVTDILSLYANKNLFASILLLFLPFLFLSYLYSNIIGKLFAITTILGSLFFIVILLARAVWVATILVILIMIGYSFLFLISTIRQKKITHFTAFSNKRNFTAIFTILIVSSLIVANYVYNNKTIMFNIIRQLSYSSDSKKIRLEVWKKTEEIISYSPILGVGTGNWKFVFPTTGLESFSDHHHQGSHHFIRPHNDYLWVFAENGIVGFVLYISLFILMLYYSIRTSMKQKDTDAIIMAIVTLGLIGYMTIAFFSFPRERVAHTILLHLLFAIVIVKNKIVIQPNLVPKVLPFLKKNMIILGMCITTLGCLTVSYYQLKGEYYTNKALGLEADGKIDQIFNKFNESIREQNPPRAEPIAQKAEPERKLKNRADSVIFYMPKARNIFYKIDFITPLAWYEGMAFARKGWHDRAFVKFEEAYEIHPNHLHVINNLATYHTSMENYDLAVELYEKALKISPKFKDGLLNLISVHSLKGDNEAALKLILFHNLNEKEDIERIKPVLYHLQSRYSDIIPNEVMKEPSDKIVEILDAIKSIED